MKRQLALSAVALLTVGLAACSTQDSAAPQGDPLECVTQTATLGSEVTVTGDKGGELTIDADIKDETLDALKIVSADKGDGNPLVSNPDVIYNMTLAVAGPDGQILAAQPVQSTLDLETSGLVTWVLESVGCITDNGRLVAAGPASTIFPGVVESSGGEITAETPLITVIDMQGVQETLSEDELLQQAEGKEVALPEGFPEVTFNEETGPVITVPEGLERPTELTIAPMIEGEGETVEAGAKVYVHYRGVMWSTGEEFDSSWSRGESTSFSTDQVIPGFSEALIGQKVGSRIVSLVDPASGYGSERLVEMGGEENDVMIFVVDILGVENPAN